MNHYQAHDQFPIKLFSNQGEVAYPENRDDKLGTYSNDVFTTEALRFIRQHQEKPFFLYLPYTAGHFE